MLSSNPDPGKRDHLLQKNTSLNQCIFEKVTFVYSFTLCYFLCQGTTIENFLNLTFEQSSAAGHNCLIS